MNTESQIKIGRADALDALRGLAILAMVLSGSIPFGNSLPAWMYHAQVPPPAHQFNPNLPGITWVDLVFPFFLFSMGAAFPFAMRKKLGQGMPEWKLSAQAVLRGLLLAAFAIFIQHVKPYALASEPAASDWMVGLLGFAILFAVLVRLPEKTDMYVRWGIKLIGILSAVILLALLRYPSGSGFSEGRSDIIILVLANTALFGSLIWLFTRDNILARLSVLGVLLALRLTQNIEGSWNYQLWNFSPFPWMYKLYYLQYLFIVIPGSIAGDYIYRWFKETAPETRNNEKKRWLMPALAILMFLTIPVNLIGLFTRQVMPVLISDALIILISHWLLKLSESSSGELYRKLFMQGVYWLVVGLFFEAYEGGIKKDHPTLSYYFVTTGLAIFSLICLSVVTEYLGKRKYLSLLIKNGQNPMIAYIAGSNFVLPVLVLTSLNTLLAYLQINPWLGFLKGVIFTLLVALLTAFFTGRKIFWRT